MDAHHCPQLPKEWHWVRTHYLVAEISNAASDRLVAQQFEGEVSAVGGQVSLK